jgi:hypothetical protein
MTFDKIFSAIPEYAEAQRLAENRADESISFQIVSDDSGIPYLEAALPDGGITLRELTDLIAAIESSIDEAEGTKDANGMSVVLEDGNLYVELPADDDEDEQEESEDDEPNVCEHCGKEMSFDSSTPAQVCEECRDMMDRLED